jgi:hypothetical protein
VLYKISQRVFSATYVFAIVALDNKMPYRVASIFLAIALFRNTIVKHKACLYMADLHGGVLDFQFWPTLILGLEALILVGYG